jgi:hypothetical protein
MPASLIRRGHEHPPPHPTRVVKISIRCLQGNTFFLCSQCGESVPSTRHYISRYLFVSLRLAYVDLLWEENIVCKLKSTHEARDWSRLTMFGWDDDLSRKKITIWKLFFSYLCKAIVLFLMYMSNSREQLTRLIFFTKIWKHHSFEWLISLPVFPQIQFVLI